MKFDRKKQSLKNKGARAPIQMQVQESNIKTLVLDVNMDKVCFSKCTRRKHSEE